MDWRSLAPAKTSPIPRYYQLAELIRERVRTGELTPGEQLPAERELAEHVGISRMTARQAVAYLVRDGTLVVKPGVGTFVAEPKYALHLLGFTEEMKRHGVVVSSTVLEQSVVVPPPGVATALSLSTGEPAIKIARLRSAGATPVVLETSFLPAQLCPGLETEDLERHSLYTLLELRYGLRLYHARQAIEASVANGYESDLLQIAPGTPILLLEGVTLAEDDRPAEHFKAVYRADRVKFALESRREVWTGADGAAPQVSIVLT